MTFLGRLFETRGLNDPSVPLTETSLVDWLSGTVNDSGMRVTERTAYSMPAVYRAVSLISGACAAIPLQGYKRADRLSRVDLDILNEPCPDRTSYEFFEGLYTCLMTWGNFYAFKKMNPRGEVTALVPIEPSTVKVGRLKELVTAENPTGKVFQLATQDGGEKIATVNEVWHVPGLAYDGVLGMSPIRLAAQGIGTALAAEKYSAKQFSQGSLISGVLQSDQRIPQEVADELSARWRAKVAGLARAHDIVTLGSGAKFQPIQFPNTDLQMMEVRKFQVIEIARIFGIPPHMLGDVERSTSWGTGIEQQSIGFVTYTLKAWLTRVEQRVSKEITPGEVFARYDLNSLMRGDSGQRAAYYTSMHNLGAMNADEIRSEEGMPPLPNGEGQDYLKPLNMAPAGSNDPGTSTTTDGGGAPDAAN